MLFGLFCFALVCYLPIFIYLGLEIKERRIYRFLGSELCFKDYILEVIIDAISCTLTLVSDLLQDLTVPLLRIVGEDPGDTVWRTTLLLGQEVLMYLTLNMVTLLVFVPLECIVSSLRDLQTKP